MKFSAHGFVFRLKSLFKRHQLETDMAEEMQTHFDVLTERNIAAGMSPEEARFAARKRFGGVAQLEERCRDERGFVWLEQLWKEVGFAARSLSRARAFTFTVLTMLVLGLGVATMAFNLAASVVIFGQPYPQPEQLFFIGAADKYNAAIPFRHAVQVQAYETQTTAFSEFAAVTGISANVVIRGEPVAAAVMEASDGCFRTLGIKPILGRGFLPEEHRAAPADVVVISGVFWRKHFDGAPDVLGRTLLVDSHVCTVVGVLAVAQPFPSNFDADIYRPMKSGAEVADPTALVYVIARLRPGVSPDQAQASLTAVKLPVLPRATEAMLAEQQPKLIRLAELGRPEIFWVIAMAAVLLYLIACCNAMNLVLVRLLGRQRELSIRLALGGTRSQIARLLAVESAGLALVASAIVSLAARWVFPFLLSRLSGEDALAYQSYWDTRTLVCLAALTVLAGAAVGLLPVWRAMRSGITAGLKDGGAAGESRGVARLRNSLVIFQAALAVIMLAGAGLMMRSFEQLARTDLGFDPTGKVKVQIAFPSGYSLKPDARLQLFQRLKNRLATLPGVRNVAFGDDALLSGEYWGNARLLMRDGSYQPLGVTFVSADFLRTAGLVLKKGRWLSGRPGEFEVVINEAFAKARFGDEDPVGQYFKTLNSGDYNQLIVGVVADVKENVRAAAGVRFYGPAWAWPLNLSSVMLRLDRDPGPEFAGLVRRAIYETDPQLIVTWAPTINEVIDNQMAAERYAFRMLKGLSTIALVLAIVGMFSVVAYAVDRRMKEFGVRMALGARPKDLQRLVLARGLATAAIGIALGVAGALAVTRFMQSLLFETTPYDPAVYLGVAALLLAAAGLACWLPARRAARVDVTKLLRTE